MLTVRELQTALTTFGLYTGEIDGIPGRETMKSVDALLARDPEAGPLYEDWADKRRDTAAQQIIMAKAGIEAGKVDGLVGEQTRYAWSVWEARKVGDKKVETWRDADLDKAPATKAKQAQVWPTQSGVEKFFGAPGTHHATLEFPFPMRLAWEPTTEVKRTAVNAKVLPAMQRIWQSTLDHYGHDQIKKLRLDMFGGCFNDRNMRGGSQKSMHAYAIAMDIDPERNQLKWGRDKATLDDKPYEPFWGFVYDEGAISLGRERNYDWMHFQFARIG